jgi:hypothetical protein
MTIRRFESAPSDRQFFSNIGMFHNSLKGFLPLAVCEDSKVSGEKVTVTD